MFLSYCKTKLSALQDSVQPHVQGGGAHFRRQRRVVELCEFLTN